MVYLVIENSYLTVSYGHFSYRKVSGLYFR